MATIQLILQNPAGAQTDITSYLTNDGLPDLTLEIEDDSGKWTAGDMAFTCKNESAYFTGIWTLPMDPSLVWDEATAKGCWYLQVKKGGAVRWEGDLDPASVAFDSKNKTVSFSVFGKIKRAEHHNAALVKRTVPSPLYFTCTKGFRKLAIKESDGTTPKLVSSTNLAVGDIIKCTQLTDNGAPVEQDLEIKTIGPSVPDGLDAYQVKVKGYPKKAYTNGVVANSWYRAQTVAYVAQKLFEHMGLTFASQCEVSGANSTLVVDEADFDDKTVAEALSELAAYSSSVWFTTPTKWYFLGREATKSGSAAKAIDTLLDEKSATALYDRFFLTVIARGTKDRYYRVGKITYPLQELEITTDYTSALATLQSIATAAYNAFGVRRAICEVVIRDDGTVYQLRDLITTGSENWWITRVSEPLRAVGNLTIAGSETAVRGEITLGLLQVSGTAPAAASLDAHDDNTQYDPPYPPVNLTLGKGADDPAQRPSWWSDFRTIWENSHDEWPLLKELGRVKKDDGTIESVVGRLWVARFQNHPDNPSPDGFELTVYKSGKDPTKPTQQHGYRNPVLSAGGYYYIPWYKTLSSTATDKEVVVQHWDMERSFSCFSDPANTSENGLDAGLSSTANGLAVTFNCTGAGGDGTNSGTVQSTSPKTFAKTYAAGGEYNAFLSVTDAAGNTTTAALRVVVVGTGVVTVNLVGQLLQIGTGSVNMTSVTAVPSGGAAPYTYDWDFGDGSTHITTATSGTHLFSTVGTYQVTVKVTDRTGAVGYGYVTVNVLAGAVLSASLNQYVWNGISAPFHVNSPALVITAAGGVAPYTYNIDWGDGSTPDTVANPSDHVYAAPGVYTVITRTRDSQGALVQLAAVVNVAGTSTVVVTMNHPIFTVAGGSTLASATPSANVGATAAGGTGPYTYDWYLGDGYSYMNDGTSPSHINAHVWGRPGTWNCYVRVVDSLNNVAYGYFTVVVTGSISVALDYNSFVGPSPKTASINATVTGGTGPFTFDWIWGDGAETKHTGVTSPDAASHAFTWDPITNGEFSGQVVVTDSAGLVAIAEFYVTATNPASGSITPRSVSGTGSVTGNFSIAYAGLGTPVLYDVDWGDGTSVVGGSLGSSPAPLSHTWVYSGTQPSIVFTVTIHVYDGYGNNLYLPVGVTIFASNTGWIRPNAGHDGAGTSSIRWLDGTAPYGNDVLKMFDTDDTSFDTGTPTATAGTRKARLYLPGGTNTPVPAGKSPTGFRAQLKVDTGADSQLEVYMVKGLAGTSVNYSSHVAATEVITLASSHGWSDGDLVKLLGGSFGGVKAGQCFYVKAPSGATLKIANVSGGTAVDLDATAASGTPYFQRITGPGGTGNPTVVGTAKLVSQYGAGLVTLGGQGDLWGSSLSQAEANGAGTGVQVRAVGGTTDTVSVYDTKILIDYA